MDQRLLGMKAAVALLAIALSWLAPQVGVCQQAHVGVPFRNSGSSFYENINLGWGVNAPGMFFRFNAPAPPPFGGFDPNAQATLGGGFNAANMNGFFRLSAGQGANTTFGSQTVSGTMVDGSTLVVGDSSLRPFVTSVLPVVASDPSPLRERLRRRAAELQTVQPSSAAQPTISAAVSPTKLSDERPLASTGDISVASIKAQQLKEDLEQRSEIESLLSKARRARDAGKTAVAKIYYQQALRRVAGEEADSVRKELDALARP